MELSNNNEEVVMSIPINPLTSRATQPYIPNSDNHDDTDDIKEDHDHDHTTQHVDLKRDVTDFWHHQFIPKRSFNCKHKNDRKKYNPDGPTKGYWSAGVSKVSHTISSLKGSLGPYQSHSSSEVSDFLAHMTITKPRKLFAFKTEVCDPTKSNKKKKDENNMDHKLYYVAIDHAPELQIHDEINVISKHVPIQQYLGLTLSRFKQLLQDQPERIHLAFHGEYNEHKNETIIKFDTVPILPQLLLSNETFLYKGRTVKYYRDYFAAIAILIEKEILTFIKQPKNEFGEPLYKIRYINSEGLFDTHLKLAKLLKNIVQTRFQCPSFHYRSKKFVAVWYGKWDQNEETKELEFKQKPNEWLMEQYHIAEMCKNKQIDGTVRKIKRKYDKLCEKNPRLAHQINNDYQLFHWTIMNIAIKSIVPNEVWTWLDNFDLRSDFNHNNHMNVLKHGGRSDSANSTDSNDPNGIKLAHETGIDIFAAFQRTYELRVQPVEKKEYQKLAIPLKSQQKLVVKPTETETKIEEQKIAAVLKELIKDICQDPVTAKGKEWMSPPFAAPFTNCKILRFTNSNVFNLANSFVQKAQRKYRNKYTISFLPLHQSSIPAYLFCGYVQMNEERAYTLDPEHGRDEISKIVKETLIAKDQCKIKLLALLGCHSYHLAEIFKPYIENIICVHPKTEIDDNICIEFSGYFYQFLREYDNKSNKLPFKYTVKRAFQDALDKVKSSYKSTTACQFHQGVSSQISDISHIEEVDNMLMIIRVDLGTHQKLKDHVNRMLPKKKDNLIKDQREKPNPTFLGIPRPKSSASDLQPNPSNSHSNDFYDDDIPNPNYNRNAAAGSRGGNASINTGAEFPVQPYEQNNQRKSISLESISLKQCTDPAVDDYWFDANDDYDDDDDDFIGEDDNQQVRWEWIENKNTPHFSYSIDFSYSIIKCDSYETKLMVEKILRQKKLSQETVLENRLKVSNTLTGPWTASEYEDDETPNLSWDILSNIPTCNCKKNIPHRIEDELILLTNGQHIGRNIPMTEDNGQPVKYSKSVPTPKHRLSITDANFDLFKGKIVIDKRGHKDIDITGEAIKIALNSSTVTKQDSHKMNVMDPDDGDYEYPSLSFEKVSGDALHTDKSYDSSFDPEIESNKLKIYGFNTTSLGDIEDSRLTCYATDDPEIDNDPEISHQNFQSSEWNYPQQGKEQEIKAFQMELQHSVTDDEDKELDRKMISEFECIIDDTLPSYGMPLSKSKSVSRGGGNHLRSTSITSPKIGDNNKKKSATRISRKSSISHSTLNDEHEHDHKQNNVFNLSGPGTISKRASKPMSPRHQHKNGNKTMSAQNSYKYLMAPPSNTRFKYNIKIEAQFTKQMAEIIKEDILELYGYIDKITGIAHQEIFKNGSIKIINYDFHDKSSDETLYCICDATNIPNKNNHNYKWKMKDKLFTARDIFEIYQISKHELPKSWRSSKFESEMKNEQRVKEILSDPKELEKILTRTAWHKMDCYQRQYNKRRMVLKLDKPEFIKSFRKFVQDSGSDENASNAIKLVPIMMFENKKNHNNNRNQAIYNIQFVWIISIEKDIDVGIAFKYNSNKNKVECCGIHLDQKLIFAQHQLVSPFASNILNEFKTNITHLKIGNPDDDQNKINALRNQVTELKRSSKQELEEMKNNYETELDRIKDENQRLKAKLKSLGNNHNNNSNHHYRHSPSHSNSQSMSLSAMTPTGPFLYDTNTDSNHSYPGLSTTALVAGYNSINMNNMNNMNNINNINNINNMMNNNAMYMLPITTTNPSISIPQFSFFPSPPTTGLNNNIQTNNT